MKMKDKPIFITKPVGDEIRFFKLFKAYFFLISGFILLFPCASEAVRLYSWEERYPLPAGKTISREMAMHLLDARNDLAHYE